MVPGALAQPQKYGYEAYNTGTREERRAKSEKRKAIEQSHEVPARISNAVKYEGSDKHGYRRPEYSWLEEQLFEDQMPWGIEFDKYSNLSPRHLRWLASAVSTKPNGDSTPATGRVKKAAGTGAETTTEEIMKRGGVQAMLYLHSQGLVRSGHRGIGSM